VKYSDTNTAELREVDVVARSRKAMPQHLAPGWVELHLVIECKHTDKDKPWIMFIGDNRFTRSGQRFECLDIIGPGGLQLIEARSADDMPVISHTGEVAYSVKVTQQRDDAFVAVQQVNSAVMALKPTLDEDAWLEPTVVTLVPVVVIDSSLVECRLDPSGDVQLSQADRGLLVTKLRAEDRFHAVWIVTENGLDAFLGQARTTINNMVIDR
jgi:hypothetical protein